MNKALRKSFVKEEENERNKKYALKLQELVKERIKDIHIYKSNDWYLLQSLVEESEK